MVSRNVLFDEKASWQWKETVHQAEIGESAEGDEEIVEDVQPPSRAQVDLQ